MGFAPLLSFVSAANAVLNFAEKLIKFVKRVRARAAQKEETGMEANGGDASMTSDNHSQESNKGKGILGLVDEMGGSLGGNKVKLAKKEEAELRRKQVENCLIDIGTQKTLMGQNVERVLLQARKKGLTPAAKQTLYIKWRIAKQQYDYCNTMYENLLMIQSRMQISDMTVEFGEAIGNATAVLRQNNKVTPDFGALMKRFNQQIAPVNEMMGKGFEDMTKMLLDVEMSSDDLYTKASFDAAVRGEVSGAEENAESIVTEEKMPPDGGSSDSAKRDDIAKTLEQLARDLGGK